MSKPAKISDSESPLNIVPYQAGDESSVLELFEKVFKKSRSLEHWKWKYTHNPNGDAIAFLTKNETNGKVAAHFAQLPVQINNCGVPLPGVQSIDLMVMPELRAKGFFGSSGEIAFSQLKRDGYCLAFAFPNFNSYPGFIRRLGWDRITFLKSYTKKLSPKPILQRYLPIPGLPWTFDFIWNRGLLVKTFFENLWKNRNTRGYKTQSSSRVPKGYDALWKKASGREILSIWKDEKYFKWRYDEHPDHEFTYHYLEKEGEIEAIAVTVEDGNACEILELIVNRQDVLIGRFLVRKLIRWAIKMRFERLNFSASGLSFFDEVFNEFQVARVLNHVFCIKALNSPPSEHVVFNPDNWTVTHGDSDAF